MSEPSGAPTAGWTTRWICRSCRTSVGQGPMVCPRCGLLLSTPGARIPDDRPAAPPSVEGGADERREDRGAAEADGVEAGVDGVEAGVDGRRRCPNPGCRRPLSSPNALICFSCMTDAPPPGADQLAVPPGPSGGAGRATVGRPPSFVRLEFRGGGVRIDASNEAVIGRQGTHGSAAVLARSPDVSRRHALVRVDDDGTVRVRDGSSTNGTYVDGRKIGDGWVELPDGAQLRLGVEVSATVRYGRPLVRRSGGS